MELERAKDICRDLAEHKKRWGRHAGNGEYTDETVREALLSCYEYGLFDASVDKDAVTLANRQKGAAEARATRYKAQLDDAHKRIEELTIALEDAEKKVESKKGFFG